jgi:hypothetical protein
MLRVTSESSGDPASAIIPVAWIPGSSLAFWQYVYATVEATYVPDVNMSEADATDRDQRPNVALKLTTARWIARAPHALLLTRPQLYLGVRELHTSRQRQSANPLASHLWTRRIG